MVSLYILKSAYYLCRLKRGAFVISVLNMVFSIIGLLILVTSLGMFWNRGDPDDEKHIAAYLLILAALTFIAFSTALQIGLREWRRDLILLYLVATAIATVLVVASLFVVVEESPWYATLIGLIACAFLVYDWLIIFSYYMSMIAASSSSSTSSESTISGAIFRKINVGK